MMTKDQIWIGAFVFLLVFCIGAMLRIDGLDERIDKLERGSYDRKAGS